VNRRIFADAILAEDCVASKGMWRLRFWRRCLWRTLSPGVWRLVAWYKYTGVFQDPIAAISRQKRLVLPNVGAFVTG